MMCVRDVAQNTSWFLVIKILNSLAYRQTILNELSRFSQTLFVCHRYRLHVSILHATVRTHVEEKILQCSFRMKLDAFVLFTRNETIGLLT